MFGAAPAGTVITMGVLVIVRFVTSIKPAVFAEASKSILYLFGLPVVAIYGRLARVEPLQTDGLEPNVMVGKALMVTDWFNDWLQLPIVAFTETLPVPAEEPQSTIISAVP